MYLRITELVCANFDCSIDVQFRLLTNIDL